MFRRILLPVDLSETHREALERAAEIAQASSGEITLLHVIETIRDVPFEELRDFYASLEKKAEGVLDSLTAELAEGVGAVQRVVRFGKRGPEIVRFAEENRMDLIVLSSHRVEREHPAESFGTISHQVALLAPCAVLLVR